MKKYCLIVLAFLAIFIYVQNTHAAELITNGGFETGNFTGWTAINAPSPYEPWAVTTSGVGFTDTPVPTAVAVPQGSFDANEAVASNAGSFLLYQDVTIPAATSARLTWIHRYQMNHTGYCVGAGCGLATFAVEILTTSNVLLQTLYTATTPPNTNTNTGFLSNQANLSAYAGQTIRIRFRTTITVNYSGPGRIEIDAVSVQAPGPTAANGSVGGRVLSYNGKGITNAAVKITDASGNTRTVITNAFGNYRIDDLPTGTTYVMSLSHKQYLFTDSPRVVSLSDDYSSLDFRASP